MEQVKFFLSISVTIKKIENGKNINWTSFTTINTYAFGCRCKSNKKPLENIDTLTHGFLFQTRRIHVHNF